MMTVEQDILSAPDILTETFQRVAERRPEWDQVLEGPVAFLGCGSSYCIAQAAAHLYESERNVPAQAILPSQYVARPEWSHVAISRSGTTAELLEALNIADKGGISIGLVVGDPDSAAEAISFVTLPLEFAAEQGVIQTRFILAAIFALETLIDGGAGDDLHRELPRWVRRGLTEFDPGPLMEFDHIVFLGHGWRYGLALSAALTFQETTFTPALGYQTLDYRHGPIAVAGNRSLIWCLDPLNDPATAGIVEEVQKAGALVRWSGDDPIVELGQAQLFAARKASAMGLDPTPPRRFCRPAVTPSA